MGHGAKKIFGWFGGGGWSKRNGWLDGVHRHQTGCPDGGIRRLGISSIAAVHNKDV